MHKLYSQLRQYDQPMKPFIEKRHLYGFVFLLVVFGMLISLIYNWQYGKTNSQSSSKIKDDNVIICLQVITTARNKVTGEIKDFPTPCNIPPGWIKVDKSIK